MTIQDEEILGLLGTNGAGKTTMMLMIGTVYRPTSGKISENGLDVVQRPKIAVFDEPTAFLDVPSRLLMRKMIRELRDEGSTVIDATNMMDEAERLSDRVAIVNLGKLVAIDTPEQLKGKTKGGEVLELTVGNGQEFPRECLKQFSEVQDVNQENNKVTVYLSGGRLLLPKIVETLTNRGVKIDSVHLKEVTLEDVFLNYTGHRLE